MLKKITLTSFVLFLTIGLFTQCNAQKRETEKQTTVANTGVVDNRPSDEAKIEGNIPDYVIKDKNLYYLQTLPLPEIQFVFESQDNNKIALPENAKNILSSHWKDALKLRYELENEKSLDAQKYGNKISAIFNLSEKPKRQLKELEINAPNGKRKISDNEAREIVGLVNLAAVKIMEQAKAIE